MQFKSVNRFWQAGAGSALAISAAMALFGAHSAQATMTVTVSGRSVVTNAGGAYFATVNSTSSPPLTVSPGIIDSGDGFKTVDVGKTASTDDSARSNQIVLNVYSDKSFSTLNTSTQEAVIIVTATNGSKEIPVPINAATPGQTTERFQSGLFHLGIKTTEKAVIQVGLYPQDICSYFAANFGGTGAITAYGCSLVSGTTYYAPAPTNGATGTAATLQLKVYVSFVNISDATTGDGRAPDFANTTSQQDPLSTTLNFTARGPTSAFDNCPDTTTASGIYFPGDSEIKLRTDNLKSSTYATIGSAPLQEVLVAIKDYGSATPASPPAVTSFPSTGADNIKRVPLGGEQTIDGLINTSQSEAHLYGMSFLIRDSAGLVGIPTVGTKTECGLTNVQVSEIMGFLKQGNCFIATAAFRSYDAAPVEMLRQFRNHVLLKFDAGRAFVQWYYSWSPHAAEWLMENPEFRFPVLMALLPLQAFAWLALHPAIWVMLVSLVVIVAVGVTFSQATRGSRRRAAR